MTNQIIELLEVVQEQQALITELLRDRMLPRDGAAIRQQIQEAAQRIVERTERLRANLTAMLERPDSLAGRLQEISDLANQAGAEGIWLIRGAQDASLTYTPGPAVELPDLPAGVLGGLNFTLNLEIADTGVLVVMRFPSDGKESGIEAK
jgi:hypothetical protein